MKIARCYLEGELLNDDGKKLELFFFSLGFSLSLQRHKKTTTSAPSLFCPLSPSAQSPPSLHILVKPLPLHWEQRTKPVPPQTRHCSPAPRAPTRPGARPKKSRWGGFPPFARSFFSRDAATSSIVRGRESEDEAEAGLPLPEHAKQEQPPVPRHREHPTGASPRPTAQAAAPAVASTAPPMMASWTVADRRPWQVVEEIRERGEGRGRKGGGDKR